MGGKSSKRKGKAFERKIASILSRRFNTNVQRVPCSGALDGWEGDLRDLSGVLKNFVWECKHQERINIWQCLRQSQAQASCGRTPILVFTKNYEDNYISMKLEDFMDILQQLE